METLNMIWNYVLPVGGGVAVSAILTFLVTTVVKAAANKVFGKIDVEEIEKKAVEKGVEKVKTISFKQSLEPLAKSELRKIAETVLDVVDDKIESMSEQYYSMLNVLSVLASYFDTSVAVPDEKKQALHEAIKNAAEGRLDREQIITVSDEEPATGAEISAPTPEETAKPAEEIRKVAVER